MVILNNCDFIEQFIINASETGLYSFLFHPLIKEYKEHQTEKNKKIIDGFDDESSTFLLKFTSFETSYSL